MSVLILLVYKLIIESSKYNRENYSRKCFWTRETRVKFNPGLSANQPSNNWAPQGRFPIRQNPRLEILETRVGNISGQMERLSSHGASFTLFVRHHHVTRLETGLAIFEIFLVDLPLRHSCFCFYQQETRSFTWNPSSIGLVDAILNDKIRNEKKNCPWTTLAGKH